MGERGRDGDGLGPSRPVEGYPGTGPGRLTALSSLSLAHALGKEMLELKDEDPLPTQPYSLTAACGSWPPCRCR